MATTNPISENTVAQDQAAADLLVLVTAMTPEHFKESLGNLVSAFPHEDFVVATQNELPANAPSSLRIVATPQTNASWSIKPVDFSNAARCGREHGAKAILILGPEADSLSPVSLRALADAVLKGSVDLSVPYYSLPVACRFDQLRHSVPSLTRGRSLRRIYVSPLSIDLGICLPRMAERLAGVAEQFSAANQ